jgi:hypothetical protein
VQGQNLLIYEMASQIPMVINSLPLPPYGAHEIKKEIKQLTATWTSLPRLGGATADETSQQRPGRIDNLTRPRLS